MLKPTPEVNKACSHEAGDETLRTLFEREESNMLRYSFSLTGRRAVAEEIVQEVFLQLHARWAKVENPQAWLISSIRNRAFNHLRNSKRELLQGNDEVNAATAKTANSNEHAETPEAQIARMESAATLRGAIDELGTQDRELVHLKYFEELKYREISERTGLSISNVGYRLHHILKQLASRLEPLGMGE